LTFPLLDSTDFYLQQIFIRDMRMGFENYGFGDPASISWGGDRQDVLF